MSSTREKWESGRRAELKYWEMLLPKSGTFTNPVIEARSAIYKKRLNLQEKVLIPELNPLLGRIRKHTVQTLEVGPGPIPRLGTIKTEKFVVVNTLDPLMDDYIALMKERGVDLAALYPAGRLVTGMAEQACDYFTRDSMDLIYCSNALDHCASPVTAAQALFSICAPGGFMYLSGLANEGENEKYSGYHQWNLHAEENDIHIWRPDENYSLRSSLSGSFDMKCYAQDRGSQKSWHAEVVKLEVGDKVPLLFL